VPFGCRWPPQGKPFDRFALPQGKPAVDWSSHKERLTIAQDWGFVQYQLFNGTTNTVGEGLAAFQNGNFPKWETGTLEGLFSNLETVAGNGLLDSGL